MSKLTLSIDERVVARAKEYAKERGTSVSEMVETYLASVAEPQTRTTNRAPILRALRGSLKKGTVADYRKHLSEKYK